MIVYVESNFVLELVLSQEQSLACEALVALADEGAIELAIPSYAFLEPEEKLVRRGRERKRLSDSLANELNQLTRSSHLSGVVTGLNDVPDVLLFASHEEQRRADEERLRLLGASTVLSVDGFVVREAFELSQRLRLSLPDATMLASVLADLRRHPGTAACFLNRNAKDFSDPDIVSMLADLGCSAIFSFVDGLNYVRHESSQLR